MARDEAPPQSLEDLVRRALTTVPARHIAGLRPENDLPEGEDSIDKNRSFRDAVWSDALSLAFPKPGMRSDPRVRRITPEGADSRTAQHRRRFHAWTEGLLRVTSPQSSWPPDFGTVQREVTLGIRQRSHHRANSCGQVGADSSSRSLPPVTEWVGDATRGVVRAPKMAADNDHRVAHSAP